MRSPGISVTAGYSGAIATAAALLINGRSPIAAVQALASRTDPKVVTAHGWSATRQPNGSVWYRRVLRDEHGFEMSGRSGPDPPPGIDPTTIPITEHPADTHPAAARLADALRLVRTHRNGSPLALIPENLIGVADGQPDSDARLAALYRLETSRKTLAAGQRQEYLQPFLDALANAIPEPGSQRDVAPLRALAAHFGADIEREREDLTLDARVAALVELFTAAVRELDDTGVLLVSTGLVMWRPIAGDNVLSLLDHLMMMCRKSRDVGLLERLAKTTRERASRLQQGALDATSATCFARNILGCCHAAWLSDSLFQDLAQHRSAIARLVSDPMFGQLATVAEELMVRAAQAAVNWLEALRGTAFAEHRIDIVRRMRAAGAAAGKAWATELVEVYLYYPRCCLPFLVAADPGGSLEVDTCGGIPAIGTDAKLQLLQALGLIRFSDSVTAAASER